MEDDSSGNEDLDVLEPALQNFSKEEKDAARKAQREQARRFIAAKISRHAGSDIEHGAFYNSPSTLNLT